MGPEELILTEQRIAENSCRFRFELFLPFPDQLSKSSRSVRLSYVGRACSAANLALEQDEKMKFVMLNYEVPADVERILGNEDDEFWGAWEKYSRALTDAGVIVSGDPLQPSPMGTTIRVRDGQRDVQDGPYAETKEQLGGYIVLELASLDEAIEWAEKSPVAALGAVEIRPLSDAVAKRCRDMSRE